MTVTLESFYVKGGQALVSGFGNRARKTELMSRRFARVDSHSSTYGKVVSPCQAGLTAQLVLLHFSRYDVNPETPQCPKMITRINVYPPVVSS